MDGKLTNRVKVDESMWNVDRETCTLCINLEKAKELMWKSVLEGEKEIDITKVRLGSSWIVFCANEIIKAVGFQNCGISLSLSQIDNTRNISEFDEEAQAAIQRASYDHHMKMQGLPTSQDKVEYTNL